MSVERRGPIHMMKRLPLTARVPAAVAALMILLSIAVSERALARFAADQAKHLEQLGAAYLDGLSSALTPYLLRNDVWEVFDQLDRARGQYDGLGLVTTTVSDEGGRVIASTEPRRIPTGSRLEGASISSNSGLTYLERDITYQNRKVGTIQASVDTSPLTAERRQVLTTLVLTNAAITAGLTLLGFLAVRYMVRPLRDLSSRLSAGGVQPWHEDEIPPDPETGRMFRAYNQLVESIEQQRAMSRRMAEKERLASLGQLASTLAHEINNPLGGLQMAVDTLREHGADAGVRGRMVDLLGRGLDGIGAVVQSAKTSYRPDATAACVTADALDDLRLLIAPEIRRRGQTLQWELSFGGEVDLPAAPLRQILLNLILNASAASSHGAAVSARIWKGPHGLFIRIEDSGPGLPDAEVTYLTERSAVAQVRSGPHLGLWLVRSLATELSATISVGTSALGGAMIELDVPIAADRVSTRLMEQAVVT